MISLKVYLSLAWAALMIISAGKKKKKRNKDTADDMGCHAKLACAKSSSGFDLPEQRSNVRVVREQSVHLHVQASCSECIETDSIKVDIQPLKLRMK